MSKAVLIVEPNDARRAAIRQACAARGLQVLDVAEAMAGLAALGRADFGAVVIAEGRRHLSLRGLCQLARKRHHGIRIFVILGDITHADSVKRILGDVTMVPPEWGVEQLANETATAVEALGGPAPNPWSSGGSDSLAGESVPKRVMLPATQGATEQSEQAAETDLHLEGNLEHGSGAGLLMALCSQELTGKLLMRDVEQKLVATIFFAQGEPVWALEGDGDAGLFRRLVGQGVLSTTTTLDAVPEGTLLEHLLTQEIIDTKQMTEVMKVAVREHVLGLATAQDGIYEFSEDKSYLEFEPLLHLNSFGLIFESRRRAFSPDQLLAIGSEIGEKFLHAEPGLAVSAEKVKPFMRGLDVTAQIDGVGTVEDFFETSGLDYIMGTLMVLTMADARLVSLHDRRRTLDDSVVNVSRESMRSQWDQPATPSTALAYSGTPGMAEVAEVAGDSSAALAPEALLAIYQEIMPLTQPAQVLGTALHAEGADLEHAFQARMAEFADQRVAAHAQADFMREQLAELRDKVQSAYETLKLERPSGGIVTEDSNPF